MELVKKSLGKWIEASIVLVIGILCIVAGAQFSSATLSGAANGSDTANAISMVLGISFIVVGSLGIILASVAAIVSKAGFAAAAMTSGVSLAMGIWFVVVKTAFTLIELTLSYVPYVLIVLGAIIAADAIFILINALRDKNLKASLAAMIVGLVIAAASIVLGCLCIGDDPVISGGAQLIIFGILLIIYACFMVLATFVAVPTVSVIAVKEDKTEEVREEAPKAEAEEAVAEEAAEEEK